MLSVVEFKMFTSNSIFLFNFISIKLFRETSTHRLGNRTLKYQYINVFKNYDMMLKKLCQYKSKLTQTDAYKKVHNSKIVTFFTSQLKNHKFKLLSCT